MKKNKIVITGGAGFVGTNLINLFLKKTKYKIISIDNYSSGFKKNHIKNKRVNYIKEDTKNISQILKNHKNIKSIFHFGEFARVYQSFIKMNECINSNSIGTNSVFNYCLKNTKGINSIFHFGEFARIYQSFLKMNECIKSNSIGSNAVLTIV